MPNKYLWEEESRKFKEVHGFGVNILSRNTYQWDKKNKNQTKQLRTDQNEQMRNGE